MTMEPLVKVYESQGHFAAEVVKAKLEANGIPVLLKYESVGQDSSASPSTGSAGSRCTCRPNSQMRRWRLSRKTAR